MQYCGRQFDEEQIRWLKDFLAASPETSRLELSRRFCEQIGWRKPDGKLKEMSCRVALLRMARDGLITLPAARCRQSRPRSEVPRTALGDPEPTVSKPAGEFTLELEPVDKPSSALWNELIDRYHYLGYKPLPGAQLRYFVTSAEGTLALLGFSAAAWTTAARDRWIGWDAHLRKKNLRLIVNNSRFLILPWVQSQGLASRILALVARRLPEAWYRRYRYRPVLLETFVERDRFAGTCYKAAGWLCVGETRGRGKIDIEHRNDVPVKTVWVYPLQKDFRKRLFGGNRCRTRRSQSS